MRAERSKCSCKFYPETETNKLQFLIPYAQIILFLEKMCGGIGPKAEWIYCM